MKANDQITYCIDKDGSGWKGFVVVNGEVRGETIKGSNYETIEGHVKDTMISIIKGTDLLHDKFIDYDIIKRTDSIFGFFRSIYYEGFITMNGVQYSAPIRMESRDKIQEILIDIATHPPLGYEMVKVVLKRGDFLK